MSARLDKPKTKGYRVPATPRGWCERCMIETDPERRVSRLLTYAGGKMRRVSFCDDRCARTFEAGVTAIRELPFDALSTYGDEDWHGTVSGYVYHGCRCDWCSEARSESRSAKRKAAA